MKRRWNKIWICGISCNSCYVIFIEWTSSCKFHFCKLVLAVSNSVPQMLPFLYSKLEMLFFYQCRKKRIMNVYFKNFDLKIISRVFLCRIFCFVISQVSIHDRKLLAFSHLTHLENRSQAELYWTSFRSIFKHFASW